MNTALRCLRAAGAGLVLMAMAIAPALAGPEGWRVTPDFENDRAALEISGAVCPGSSPARRWCIAVNDEKKYVQLFAVDGRTLRPADRVRILEKRDPAGAKFGEPDLEAAAYDDGFVYVIGSHGASRSGGKVQRSRFFLYRLPVDPVSGAPRFQITRDRVADGIERTDRLRAVIAQTPGLSAFAEQPLDANGVTIEGLGAIAGRLFIGFRAPVTDAGAVVLEIPARALFGDGPLQPRIHRLDLGKGYGIRALERMNDGLLVMAGAARRNDLAPAIWFWQPGQPPRLRAVLNVPPNHKAEGILRLPASGDQRTRVLVFFDSQKNGAPIEVSLPQN